MAPPAQTGSSISRCIEKRLTHWVAIVGGVSDVRADVRVAALLKVTFDFHPQKPQVCALATVPCSGHTLAGQACSGIR